MNIKRLNLYLDQDFYDKIKKTSDREFLPIASFVKKTISLAINNSMSNNNNNAE
jgi:hypothetical protein